MQQNCKNSLKIIPKIFGWYLYYYVYLHSKPQTHDLRMELRSAYFDLKKGFDAPLCAFPISLCALFNAPAILIMVSDFCMVICLSWLNTWLD